MRESVQEKAVRLALAEKDIISRKDGREGWPDRCAYLGLNRHVWIEHKTDVGRLTPAQKRVFPMLEKLGETIVYAKGMAAEEVVRRVLHAAWTMGKRA